MENKPTCPYCGGEMKPKTGTGHNIHGNKTVWFTYCCDVCEAESPPCDSRAEAHAAAMQRADRPQGKRIDTAVEPPMSAVKFDKQSRRMCKFYNGRCIGCPFNSDLAAGCARYEPLSEEAVSRLEKWAKDHPEEEK